VASLTPERAAAVFAYESTRVTLGHLVMTDVLGEAGGRAMSVLAIVAFVSSMSAMLFVGPRVYAAMAEDGFLPRGLARRRRDVPVASVILQGALALVLLLTQRLQQTLSNLGAILTLFAALVALALFVVPRTRGLRPSATARGAAALYVLSAAWMLYNGLRAGTRLEVWLGLVAAAALAVWWRSRRGRAPGEEPAIRP
jgi:APA family basic amino acid/polyamine antiporter